MQGDEERVRQLALAGIEAEASVAVLAAAGIMGTAGAAE